MFGYQIDSKRLIRDIPRFVWYIAYPILLLIPVVALGGYNIVKFSFDPLTSGTKDIIHIFFLVGLIFPVFGVFAFIFNDNRMIRSNNTFLIWLEEHRRWDGRVIPHLAIIIIMWTLVALIHIFGSWIVYIVFKKQLFFTWQASLAALIVITPLSMIIFIIVLLYRCCLRRYVKPEPKLILSHAV